MAIQSLNQESANKWSASYDGNYGIYKIKISFDDNNNLKNYNCSCPSDYNPCKHIDMILKAISKKITINNTKQQKENHSELIKSLFNGKSKDKFIHFLIEYADYNTDFVNKLKKDFFTEKSVKSSIKINQIISDGMPSGNLENDYDDYGYNGHYEEDIEIEIFDEWKEKAVQIFGTRYSYENTQYVNSNTNVFVICPEHGEFLQNPMNHLYGYEGCAKCRKIKQHSKQQILWLQFISKINNVQIQHAENDGEFSIPNTRYKADGYCLETNTIYEFHGDYWHGNPKQFLCEEYNKTTKCSFGELYQKTVKKEELIKICGFNLITCWEYDWKKLNRCITVLQKKYRTFKSN